MIKVLISPAEVVCLLNDHHFGRGCDTKVSRKWELRARGMKITHQTPMQAIIGSRKFPIIIGFVTQRIRQ